MFLSQWETHTQRNTCHKESNSLPKRFYFCLSTTLCLHPLLFLSFFIRMFDFDQTETGRKLQIWMFLLSMQNACIHICAFSFPWFWWVFYETRHNAGVLEANSPRVLLSKRLLWYQSAFGCHLDRVHNEYVRSFLHWPHYSSCQIRLPYCQVDRHCQFLPHPGKW